MFKVRRAWSEITIGWFSEKSYFGEKRAINKKIINAWIWLMYLRKKGKFPRGLENLQGSTSPFLTIKSEIDFDIEDWVKVRGFEWSKEGSIAQFKSPPSIIRWVFKKGRLPNCFRDRETNTFPDQNCHPSGLWSQNLNEKYHPPMSVWVWVDLNLANEFPEGKLYRCLNVLNVRIPLIA